MDGGVRMTRVFAAPAAIIILAVTLSACHPGPVLSTEPNHAGGTIAGMVRATDGSVGPTTRKGAIANTKPGEKCEGTTGPNGAYTVKAPESTYRIEVETRAGEVVTKKPDDTQRANSDLDSGRDF